MPKATWGAGDTALTAADLDNAEREAPRIRYSGELPRNGTYRFVIQSLKKASSAAGNPKVTVFATLDGTWKANHKQYDGCPVFDHLPVMKSTANRVANFLDAIGASSNDLMKQTITDENGYITKLGSVGDPKGIMVYITVKRQAAEGEFQESIKVDYNGYIAVDADEVSGDAASSSGDDDAGDPPF